MCGGGGDGGAAASAERERKAREEAARIRLETESARERYRTERLPGAKGTGRRYAKSARLMEQFGRQKYGGQQTGTLTAEDITGLKLKGMPTKRAASQKYVYTDSPTQRTTPFGTSLIASPFQGGRYNAPTGTQGYMKDGKFVQTPGGYQNPWYAMNMTRQGYKPVTRTLVKTPAETWQEYEKRVGQVNAENRQIQARQSTLLGQRRDRNMARGRAAQESQRFQSKETTGKQSGGRALSRSEEEVARRSEAESNPGVPTDRRRYGPFRSQRSVGS